MAEPARVIPLRPSDGGGFGGGDAPSSALQSRSESKSTPNDDARPRNVVWDACVEVLGYEPLTDSEKSAWGRCVSSLNRAGATADDIKLMARRYHQQWPVDLTIFAIEKWYSHFRRQGAKPKRVCPECGVGGGMHVQGCKKATAGGGGAVARP